ncbi:lysozyme inhibitor LprI family protein [Jannaschia aquimarina]|uniref:Lysozyme inhibitor LprI-like N-terminal domain-containing protein n=1 Tax=Jannaschia aquimarina TaxID=935700 RepID=A0A0D1EJZ6_9RHOB|nr:lysozyme inhibitor LprI family protein [Jannaschia aquimarina]KIT16135.1 hypothetical protein jaqu_20970 [Jannaschia aquimarina]SNT37295.1 Uncharacterized conserved protein YecT, DUF1311 family [Jannaschia aquimarina]
MRRLLGVALLIAAPAAGQGVLPVDCADPDGIAEATDCAARQLQVSEDQLDLALGLALTRAEVLDQDWAAEGGAPGEVSVHDALDASQTDWIAYRDAACAAESLQFFERAEIDLALALCLARLTVRRGDDLAAFAEGP